MSQYLFILSAEIIGILIRSNIESKIKEYQLQQKWDTLRWRGTSFHINVD